MTDISISNNRVSDKASISKAYYKAKAYLRQWQKQHPKSCKVVKISLIALLTISILVGVGLIAVGSTIGMNRLTDWMSRSMIPSMKYFVHKDLMSLQALDNILVIATLCSVILGMGMVICKYKKKHIREKTSLDFLQAQAYGENFSFRDIK